MASIVASKGVAAVAGTDAAELADAAEDTADLEVADPVEEADWALSYTLL